MVTPKITRYLIICLISVGKIGPKFGDCNSLIRKGFFPTADNKFILPSLIFGRRVSTILHSFLFFSLPFPFLSFFVPHRAACGILAPQPGIEPTPLAVKARSPNHWTAREFPPLPFLYEKKITVIFSVFAFFCIECYLRAQAPGKHLGSNPSSATEPVCCALS